MDIDFAKTIRVLARGGGGNEIILGTPGASFTFEIGVTSEKQQGWQAPTKTATSGVHKMDEVEVVQSYFNKFWEEQEYDEIECTPCEPFQRH